MLHKTPKLLAPAGLLSLALGAATLSTASSVEAQACAKDLDCPGDLVCEGASLGLHVLASVDTLNNVNRFLSRKALSEFEMRVVFQMSANDSAALVDSPAAGTLGLHRALFYNEHEGYLETFRPYALPDGGWIEEARANLARLCGEAATP